MFIQAKDENHSVMFIPADIVVRLKFALFLFNGC